VTRRELSLVIPAFNAASYISGSVARALDFFEVGNVDGEVIVADDGSTDGTAGSIPADPRVRTLRLSHGGKGSALRAGVAQAGGELVAFTDADLPYGMQPLTLAMTYVHGRRYHAVVGDRTLPGSHFERPGPARGLISGVASFVFRTLVTGGIYDTQCGFKVFRGDVARELFRLSRVDGFAIDVELIYLLLKYRLDIKRIPVQLERSAPSTVRVVRDSVAAMRDIATIRLRWAAARYRSALLTEILERELREDLDGAARSGRDTKSPPRRRPRRTSGCGGAG
jgi:dolichyl-phosphate beta-glucosyltransferase